MNDSEKIKIFLNIGDQRISLNVPFDRQKFARNVEKDVDSLYRKWRQSFQGKSDKEIMAMVAYQYASFYAELGERYNEAHRLAEVCMRNVNGADKNSPAKSNAADNENS